jgi:hypothetical protein
MVVSNTLIVGEGDVVKSRYFNAPTAISNSFFIPMIQRVSRVSTSVAPQPPNPFLYPPDSGRTSSCNQAFFLYPFQVCLKLFLTAASFFCLLYLSTGDSLPNLCWIDGIWAGGPFGSGIIGDVNGHCRGRVFQLKSGGKGEASLCGGGGGGVQESCSRRLKTSDSVIQIEMHVRIHLREMEIIINGLQSAGIYEQGEKESIQ